MLIISKKLSKFPAGYDLMRAQLQYLREQIEKRRGTHRLNVDVDIDMHRLQSGNQILGENSDSVEDLIKFWNHTKETQIFKFWDCTNEILSLKPSIKVIKIYLN